MRLSETFWIAPKGPPFICFDILQHNGCQKIAKGPPFTFFGTVTLFKNIVSKNFSGNFLMSPKGPPFNFFFIFCNQLEFHKARRAPRFSILSLRYGANFGRSRLVFIFNGKVTIVSELQKDRKQYSPNGIFQRWRAENTFIL